MEDDLLQNVRECDMIKQDVLGSLMSPITLGDRLFRLSHRIVMAPVTRCRALGYVPQPAHVEYYSQRATAGGLLISEGVGIAPEATGFPHSPGIWDERQIAAWKEVVTAVHNKGGIMFCQLWHVGRASHTYYQPHGRPPVSSTGRRLPKEWSVQLPWPMKREKFSEPRALRTDEIPYIVEQYRQAARNARNAGFDGVEIHAAHGYLIDQFLKDGINDRTDAYGGPIENRCRFALEVVEAVGKEVGYARTALRISPVIDHLDATDSDPQALGLHLVGKLNNLPAGLAYLHMTTPRFSTEAKVEPADGHENCLQVLRQAYRGVVMASGGYTRESGMEAVATGAADLVAYGRLFISNPDLPLRFVLDAPLNRYHRATFYTHDQFKGYLDYPRLCFPHDHHLTKLNHLHQEKLQDALIANYDQASKVCMGSKL